MPADAKIHVFHHRADGDDPFFFSVFGAEEDAGGDGVAFGFYFCGATGDEDFAGVGSTVAENEFEKLGAARADESEDAEDFAAGVGEICGSGESEASEVADFERDLAARARGVMENIVDVAADHTLDELVGFDIGER